MAKFITRVQLQEAQQTDIEKLDIEMERESFTRVDKPRDADKKRLSNPIEYNLHSNISLLDVNGAVSRAANRTGKKYSFTVIREKRISLQ
ncbi:MAG TPA: hypothetical protein VNS58_28010 [Puia sp.]|jgi:hypothetical protein|nr:hypothetical protein [Puia sp.]